MTVVNEAGKAKRLVGNIVAITVAGDRVYYVQKYAFGSQPAIQSMKLPAASELTAPGK